MGVGSTLDTVDECRDFREEGVVIGELVSLLVVISWSSTQDISHVDQVETWEMGVTYRT